MYYYLWILTASLILIIISTVVSIRRIHTIKSYKKTIKQFNEIHLKLDRQIKEDSFNIWDTVYVINTWHIEKWVLSYIVEWEDWLWMDVEFQENDSDYATSKRYSPIVVFPNLLKLIDYYSVKFINILDDMENEDAQKYNQKKCKGKWYKWKKCA